MKNDYTGLRSSVDHRLVMAEQSVKWHFGSIVDCVSIFCGLIGYKMSMESSSVSRMLVCMHCRIYSPGSILLLGFFPTQPVPHGWCIMVGPLSYFL